MTATMSSNCYRETDLLISISKIILTGRLNIIQSLWKHYTINVKTYLCTVLSTTTKSVTGVRSTLYRVYVYVVRSGSV